MANALRVGQKSAFVTLCVLNERRLLALPHFTHDSATRFSVADFAHLDTLRVDVGVLFGIFVSLLTVRSLDTPMLIANTALGRRLSYCHEACLGRDALD